MTEAWMKLFPSTIVTRSYSGDKTVAHKFDGEGTKLLYQLKNLMKFNDLGQNSMERTVYSNSGIATITARSVFGHAYIDIKALGGVMMGATCCKQTTYVAPSITYTSLQMTGGESQDLTVEDEDGNECGCPPFTWELTSGNGTIAIPPVGDSKNPMGDNREVTFTAPTENPDCPPAVITVTDVCGMKATISISITIDVGGVAYQIWEWTSLGTSVENITNTDSDCCGGPHTWVCPDAAPANLKYTMLAKRYNCTGDYADTINFLSGLPLYEYCDCPDTMPTAGDASRCAQGLLTQGEDCGWSCGTPQYCPCQPYDELTSITSLRKFCFDPDCTYPYSGTFYDHVSMVPPYLPLPPWVIENVGYDGQVQDKRTPEMIAQGCCPINPLTGLPF